MGTRINVLLDHKVQDFRNRAAVIAQLEPTLPPTQVVREYWRNVDPECFDEPQDSWVAHGKDYLVYKGPGGLFLRFAIGAAVIWTTGRWRGFLRMALLRRAYLDAFRSIARALEATRLVYYPDNDHVEDAVSDGRSQENCIEILEQQYGPHQLSVEVINAEIVAEAEHQVPEVWFVESLTDDT